MTYPPRPSDDEPRSQPFQPQSYDLAPEYGTPQPAQPQPTYPPPPGQQPPYPPPAPQYQQQNPYQQPQQSPYQPPPPQQYQQAQQPYQAPQGQQQPYQPFEQQQQQPGYPGGYFPPPAPQKKGKGLKITLLVLGSVFLVCALIVGVFLYPVISESGANVTAPPSLPGNLNKDTSADNQKIVDQMESDLRSDVGSVDQVAAGIYNDGDKQKLVILVAATSTVLFPDTELGNAFKGFSSGAASAQLDTPQEYPAGSLGGKIKCASGKDGTVTLTLCAWADHGSVGIGVFMNRDLATSAALFQQIRGAVETR